MRQTGLPQLVGRRGTEDLPLTWTSAVSGSLGRISTIGVAGVVSRWPGAKSNNLGFAQVERGQRRGSGHPYRIPKLLTENQVLGGVYTADQSPRSRSALPYINWYINGYGPPWTSSDPSPKIGPNHGRMCTSAGSACDYGTEG
jgi:hypothetical protein